MTEQPENKTPNHLAGETSPYLLQHLYNPVDWHPWGESALQKARDEHKLLLVSVGYSACHWCHVMEHESFEDPEVADLMNAHFVPIKVDREERPDIDQVYMDAVQAMTGQGGWPMNVVCLPDGRPVWGGTYFPKEHWMHYLRQLANNWQAAPDKFAEQAEKLMGFMRQLEETPTPGTAKTYTTDDLARAFVPISQRFDFEYGGFDQAPKFPTPANWHFLLKYAHFAQDPTARMAVQQTLKRMAWGGIFDHVGGGFARYSVDKHWHVPHFEKMLYDNGQLLSLYSEGFRWSGDPLYRHTIAHTIDWLGRELRAPEGAFFSALDADSEGEEGKFYVWKKQEIDELLGEDAQLYAAYYNVSENGNWEEGKNVLIRTSSAETVAKAFGLSEQELQNRVARANETLLQARAQRVRPGLDDKILLSWNALTIKGLTDAYRTFGETGWLELAETAARFLHEQMTEGGRLFRNYKAGKATINAYLDDYAFYIDALIGLYQATFKEAYLERAQLHLAYVQQHFWDDDAQLYWYTSALDAELFSRKKEIYDSVTPSSNAVMAHNLLTLSHLLANDSWAEQAGQMLSVMDQYVEKHLSSFSHWGSLLMRHVFPDYEVVIAGPEAHLRRAELETHFLPNAVLAGATGTEATLPLLENRLSATETRFFVCRNRSCQLPVSTAEEALQQME